MSRINRIKIARLDRPQGLKGEIRLSPFTDDIERFTTYHRFYLHETSDKVLVPEYFREHAGGLVVKFEKTDDRDASQRLTGSWLWVDREEVKEDGWLIDDFLGLTVVSPDGESIGELTGFFDAGTDGLFEVRTSKGDRLVPCTKDYWGEPDLINQKVVLTDVDGILDFDG